MELYIKQKVISIGDKYNIYDRAGNVVYKAKSKLFSPFANKKTLMDSAENPIMVIKRKRFRFMPTYHILTADGQKIAEVKRKFGFKKSFYINGAQNDLAIVGDFFGWNFSINRNGVPMGSVSKKIIHVRDSYTLSIANPAEAPFFCACVIAIDNLCHNHREFSN